MHKKWIMFLSKKTHKEQNIVQTSTVIKMESKTPSIQFIALMQFHTTREILIHPSSLYKEHQKFLVVCLSINPKIQTYVFPTQR